MNDEAFFEKQFGFTPPACLVELCANRRLSNRGSFVIRFKHVGFVVAIQHLLGMQDPRNYDLQKKRFAFAVNSDGNTIWVDLTSPQLEILQEENGEIDAIGLTMKNLRDGKWSPLR